jgi:RNA polymerase sigma-70 factor (ECF subfamily)
MSVVRDACRRMLQRLARPRKRFGDPIADPDDAAAIAPSPAELAERWRIIDRVHRAIAALDPPDRDVLVLRELYELPGDDVARRLGISLAAMKSRLHRARARIRAELAIAT